MHVLSLPASSLTKQAKLSKNGAHSGQNQQDFQLQSASQVVVTVAPWDQDYVYALQGELRRADMAMRSLLEANQRMQDALVEREVAAEFQVGDVFEHTAWVSRILQLNFLPSTCGILAVF